MTKREHDALDPAAERDLAAIDAALGGRPVPSEHADLADLALELRGQRPTARQEFVSELDASAAAGFPASPRRARIKAIRLRLPRRRLPAFAGGLAVALIAVGIGVSQLGDEGDEPVGGGAAISSGEGAETAAPGLAVPPVRPSDAEIGGGRASAAPPGDAFATGAGQRKVERDAQLTLSAERGQVQSVAGDVFEVVRRHQGIVLSSSVRDGADAGASFDLLVPSAQLGAALGDLSELADVRARSEGTLDITKPFITVTERLRDARTEAEALLEQLAEAATETEIESIRARLAAVRGEIAALRAAKERLERRADFARVRLEIVSAQGSGSGAWTIGDAFDDAGRVLTVVAGITVVGLAVLLPIGLLGGLLWGARRVLVRRGREAALG